LQYIAALSRTFGRFVSTQSSYIAIKNILDIAHTFHG
jgi:hypothetical protein